MSSTTWRPSERVVRWSFLFALIAWTMFAGKDVSWDVVNHQLYLPFSWLTGRFRTDLFGAGPQSYQNPLGYFPVYGLIRIGLPAWVIGVLLGAFHALSVWPLDRIAKHFWPRGTAGDFWLRLLALAFCCGTPVFLIHEGTTSIDPVTSLLVLWGVALTLQPSTSRAGRDAFLAGACVGLASALKLSNAPFAVVLAVVWLLRWGTGQLDLRRIVLSALGLGATFAIAAGPWMWWLWQDFRNPIFPLFNNVFHSPDAPQQAITALRFVPKTFAGAVSRLWELGQLSSYVSYEAFLPDIRPALAALAACLAAMVMLARGGWRRLAALPAWQSQGAQLALFLVLSYVLWIRSSGNARYGLPLFMLVGIGLVRAAQIALPLKAAKVVLLTALVLQTAFYATQGDFRFTGTTWDSGPYIAYRVPPRLRDQPFLHLAIGSQTDASVALFLDERGALANPIGQFAIPTEGPLGLRFEALLSQWHGRTRVLMPLPVASKPDDVRRTHDGLTALLYRVGLDVDWQDCETIEQLLASTNPDEVYVNGLNEIHSKRLMASCAVLYRPQRNPVVEAQLADANRVFAIMEAACPKLFSPTPLASEHGNGVWQRHYMNTEAELTVSLNDGVFYTHFRSVNGVGFGTIQDILQHRKPITCPQPSYQTPM